MFKAFTKNSIKIVNLNNDDYQVRTYHYFLGFLLFTRTKTMRVRREQPGQIFNNEILTNGRA